MRKAKKVIQFFRRENDPLNLVAIRLTIRHDSTRMRVVSTSKTMAYDEMTKVETERGSCLQNIYKKRRLSFALYNINRYTKGVYLIEMSA